MSIIEHILSAGGNIMVIVIGVGILIFVHELGHFIVAKWSKVRAEVFSLGFGPTLWGFRRGETFYRIGLIPLGGYVKMAGENVAPDKEKPKADYEFHAKPPMTRVRIFAAGAIMNLIFAFPACIVVYLVGINLAVPVVGTILPGSSEWESNLLRGDRIVAIAYENKEVPITSIDTYRREVLRVPHGTTLKLKVQRGAQELVIPIIAQGSAKLGMFPAQNLISRVKPGSAADRAGLKTDDEIIEVNGEAVVSGNDIARQIYPHPGKPIPVKIRRINQPSGQPETLDLTVVPDALMQSNYELYVDGIWPPIVGPVKPGAPGYLAGLKPGDRILSINNEPTKSWNKIMDIIKSNPDNDLAIQISRLDKDDKVESITLSARPAKDNSGKGYLMITGASSNEVGEVKPGSPFALAGIQPDDKILTALIQPQSDAASKKANTSPITVTSLVQLANIALETQGAPLSLGVKRGAETFTAHVIPEHIKTQGSIGIELKARTAKEQYPLLPAISIGAGEAVDLIKLTVQLIWRLITGDESSKGLAGPIGIIQASWFMLQEGLGKFIWLLALFSINLAILNLLPIPVLDGGGIMFMVIEKIKGSPVSMMAQVVSQYIGLFLLLTLLVYATKNDLFRAFGL